jgi:hypothetical protein
MLSGAAITTTNLRCWSQSRSDGISSAATSPYHLRVIELNSTIELLNQSKEPT